MFTQFGVALLKYQTLVKWLALNLMAEINLVKKYKGSSLQF